MEGGLLESNVGGGFDSLEYVQSVCGELKVKMSELSPDFAEGLD